MFSPSMMRMAFASLVVAALAAIIVFWGILQLQRGRNAPLADNTATTQDGTNPLVSDRLIEQVFVDGQLIQLEILPSKYTLTEAEWVLLNQQPTPAPVVEVVEVVPDQEPTPIIVVEVPPTAIPPTPVTVPNTSVDKVIFKPYTVMAGDSLYSIALANNSAIELMALHGIDAKDLVPGNLIERLPYANPAYCPGYLSYVVRDHDTVFSIARTRHSTVDTVAQLNRLDANHLIYAADVICIP